ncbi:MAG: 1-acyl-sn-glycerol-3-phosphate acyltransferase [Nocardioides sp.]|nr:1-acyl-sn-glycerol-3-phosphate acyltransferase [Nocardioides sp.]
MTDRVLPASSDQHPSRFLLHPFRPLARGLMRRRWAIHTHQAANVPGEGPVIIAANHIGLIDGPLMAIFAPRPVHALTKHEMFEGRLGGFLRASGQIPLDRFASDPGAVKTCLRVLRDGGATGIFPEGTRGDGSLERFHPGAAYLAMVSGAPVVPLTLLGTRDPGGDTGSVPGRGARFDLVFGSAWSVDPVAWPRTREQVRATSTLLQQHMRAELERALALTGRTLPGPLPAGQSEDETREGSPTKEHHE